MMMTERPDKYIVACNLSVSTRHCPKGGLAYIRWRAGGDDRRVSLRARSHSGRWITIWYPLKRLRNFRIKTIPADHPRYQDDHMWLWDERESAERQLADVLSCWNHQRSKGRLLGDE